MGKVTREPHGWSRIRCLGMQEREMGHRNPMATMGASPDLRTADPSSWNEDPRLFPHLPRSGDAPKAGRGAEPDTGARKGILPFSKPSSLQEQLSRGKHSLAPAPGTAQRARNSSRASPAFPGLSQPRCVGKVAQKGPRPPCATTATTRPHSEDPWCSFGDKDTRRKGGTYIDSGYLLLFPKGKHRGKKTGG